MTREEAKGILTHNWTRVDNPNYSESELDEAFFMAIEALSAKPQTDLISRADAIEAVRMSEHRITIADEQGGVGTVKWDMWGVYTAEAVEAIKALPSADAVQGEWLDGWEVIRELSETRCMYNCFDENDRPMYEAMTSAIDIVRQMMGGAKMKGGGDE